MIQTKNDIQLSSEQVEFFSSRPLFSETTIDILAEFQSQSKELKEALHAVVILPHAILSIGQTAKMLAETKEHSVRDKGIAFLKTAAIVAAFAATILSGALLTSPLSLFILPLFLASSMVFSLLNTIFGRDADQKIKEIEQGRLEPNTPWYSDEDGDAMLAMMFGFGLIAPLYEVFTRESRLESILGEQQEILQENRNSLDPEHYKEQLQMLLAEVNAKSIHCDQHNPYQFAALELKKALAPLPSITDID